MYIKIQSEQPIITRNVLKSQIFDLFTKSSSEHKQNISLKKTLLYKFYKKQNVIEKHIRIKGKQLKHDLYIHYS